MPVYEIKDPNPAAEPPASAGHAPRQVRRVTSVIRVSRYEGDRGNKGRNPRSARSPSLTPDEEKTLRLMVARVNENLERREISLHLELTRKKEGYLLEVLDCTEQNICHHLKELEVDLAGLPDLLRQLQTAAGLVVDTFS
jgi:hypothetical protein